jgi:signal transduction histidine kinase
MLALLGQSLLGLSPWAILLVLFPVELLAAYVRVEQLHRQLLQAQAQIQAQGRQVALGLMAGGVAHEINNPLTAVSTSAQMLQRMQLPDPARPCLDLILKGVERCQSVTERMLTYARGDLDTKGPAYLHPAVQDTLLFLHERLQKAHLADFSTLAQAPAVAISPGALVQILSNLFSNAADAGASDIRIHHRLRDKQLELRCHDNGQGISPNQAERIFEPFFTTKEVGQGTGLGLSLCQGLVEKAGGKLQLESTSAQGSCFLLRLPLYG